MNRNSLDIAKNEIYLLDLDLQEVYRDYGAKNLYVLKRNEDTVIEDDVYGDFAQPPSYTKCLVMGTISNEVDKEKATDLGIDPSPYNYSIKVLKSSLDAHGVDNLTVYDMIDYNGTKLDILAVRPHPILGDYFVQYDIIARGETITLKTATETNGE